MEHDKRIVVYPHYISKQKSVSEGRRIPKELACDHPTTPEIVDCVVNGLKLPGEVEVKHYPRDWLIRGRVRVQLRGEDGALVNTDVPDRRTLLIKIAELVRQHPARAAGKAKPVQQQASSSGGGSAGASKQPAQQGSKKGGKKKK